MKTFYSIIKASPNSSAGDSLSLGLLLRDSEKFCLQFSESKVRIVKSLFSENPEMVDYVIKQIEQKIKSVNKELSVNGNKLFDTPHLINSDYFTYLSNYCNGIIQFSPPVFINDEMNNEKFKKLFNILIDKEPIEIHSAEKLKEKKFIQRVEKKLITRVKDKVHTNFRLNSLIIPDLYFSYEMNCIGRNGAITAAKAISFYKSNQIIEIQISHYYILIDLLIKAFDKSPSNQFYIIADEPPIDSPLHKLWEVINRQHRFNVLNSEESDRVADKIEESKAKKFLQPAGV